MSPVSTLSVAPTRGCPAIFGSADTVVAAAGSDGSPGPCPLIAETR